MYSYEYLLLHGGCGIAEEYQNTPLCFIVFPGDNEEPIYFGTLCIEPANSRWKKHRYRIATEDIIELFIKTWRNRKNIRLSDE